MRDNPIKRRIAEGGRAYGTMAFEFFTPGLPQIIKATGAEFVIFDMEHSGVDIHTMKAQIAACRGIDLVPMVRVPATQYHFIARLLDAGAMGIMVPMVETVEQAELIVSSTRYPPAGRRGAAFGVAHDDYQGGSVVGKIAKANERTLVICLIETPKGVENVDRIAAVDGVDVCWLGHFDLTNFMGIPAEFEHPRYLDAVSRIVAACDKHGKTPGFLALDDTWARDYTARGFRLMGYGMDITLFQGALRQGIQTLKTAASTVNERRTGARPKKRR
ncbi:MAG: aldolase [Proteobacteria bacterium]|nr:aldolase [Pseudomonadota bacterium]MBI3498080.1 aldolase [Pseudomonadota bacterium]